jgi:hypothetical protein
LPGQIQVTVTLKEVSLGTELNIVQEGLPDAIPPEACYLGWQESLRNPAKLVEPENQSMMWASNASFPYNDERRSVQAPVLLGQLTR